jgi:hypothetical protein
VGWTDPRPEEPQRYRNAFESCAHPQPHDEELIMSKVEQGESSHRIRSAVLGVLVAGVVVAGVVWLPSAVQGESAPARPATATSDETTAPATRLPMTVPVDPGTYELHFLGGGETTPRVLIDVPAGFVAWKGAAVLERGGPRQLSLWEPSKVKRDPCDLSNLGQDPGPSVADLAAALRAQERTRASDPVPVRLGGHEGVYLEITTPARFRKGTCPAHRFDLWTSASMATRYVGPGEVTRVWILDVDGSRVVVCAAGGGADLERRTDAILDSFRIIAPEP